MLIGQNKKSHALEIFRLNTVLYPKNPMPMTVWQKLMEL
jgi:hypothetical protein